ncbi:hypothetical protein BJF89_00910 [Corynebacterium sp. CNJ-954]|nr:hypothetical protein BJF89_00910 [Corynebacterium sp. CNJ-954]
MIVAVVSAVGAWLAAKAQASSNRDAARGNEWQGLVTQIQSWTEKRLAERDEQIASLQSRVTGLETRVTELQRKYRSALETIREMFRRHPESDVEVADDIRDDL